MEILYILAFDFSNFMKILTLPSCRILYQEIDYINEGKNADRFRRDFRNVKWARVPVCLCHPHSFDLKLFCLDSLLLMTITSVIVAGLLGLYCLKGVDLGVCSRYQATNHEISAEASHKESCLLV